MTKENAELKGERTFTLELTEAELEELDSATYEMSSYERHEAMIHARDMNKNIHSLRAKVITLVNEARFESALLKEQRRMTTMWADKAHQENLYREGCGTVRDGDLPRMGQ